MALMHRLSRLFTADAHAVLDAIEEPHAILQQAIRDMAAEVAALEQRCHGLHEDQSRWSRDEQQCQQSLDTVQEELDLSFNAGREDLAKQVLRRRLELEQLRQRLQRRQQEGAQQLEQHQARLEQYRRQLQEMRQRAALFSEQDALDNAGRPSTGDWPMGVSEQDVELALLRERQQRSAS